MSRVPFIYKNQTGYFKAEYVNPKNIEIYYMYKYVILRKLYGFFIKMYRCPALKKKNYGHVMYAVYVQYYLNFITYSYNSKTVSNYFLYNMVVQRTERTNRNLFFFCQITIISSLIFLSCYIYVYICVYILICSTNIIRFYRNQIDNIYFVFNNDVSTLKYRLKFKYFKEI